MSDNKAWPPTGATFRTKDRSGVDCEIMALDLDPGGVEQLMAGFMPCQVIDGGNVTQGAVADAIAAVGGTGTLSAKLRRVTQALEDLKTGIVLAAGSALFGKAQVYTGRNTTVAHRTSVTRVDLATPPASTAPTASDVTTGGSLAANIAHKSCYAMGNPLGTTTCSGVASTTTAADASATHVIRLTIPKGKLADGTTDVDSTYYYDIFLSAGATVTSPLWVARITEAQRAAGGAIITAVGTVGSGGPNGAGTVDIRVVGTGQAGGHPSTASPGQTYYQNTCFDLSGITAFTTAPGFSGIRAQLAIAMTDFRTLPELRITPFLLNELVSGQYHACDPFVVSVCGSEGASLYKELPPFDAGGSAGVKLAISYMSGQGMSVSAWLQGVSS